MQAVRPVDSRLQVGNPHESPAQDHSVCRHVQKNIAKWKAVEWSQQRRYIQIQEEGRVNLRSRPDKRHLSEAKWRKRKVKTLRDHGRKKETCSRLEKQRFQHVPAGAPSRLLPANADVRRGPTENDDAVPQHVQLIHDERHAAA